MRGPRKFLLPLREKVSPEATDEGSTTLSDGPARPLTRPLRGHPLPQVGEGRR